MAIYAALVLHPGGLVEAYPTVLGAQEAARPNAELSHPVLVSFSGASGGTTLAGKEDTLALLRAGDHGGPGGVGRPAGDLDPSLSSLLRTNVQKAVRQRNADAARRSVVHYLAATMAPGAKGSNQLRRSLLERQPIIAAEDAGLCRLLPAAILHDLAATSKLGFTAADAAAVASCAAGLAAADRPFASGDPAAVKAWKKTKLPARPSAADVFREGFDPEAAALRILLHTAAAKHQRAKHGEEKSWLASLYQYAVAREAREAPHPHPAEATPAALAEAFDLACKELRDDPTLPKSMRLTESVDGHNPERLKRIRIEAGKQDRELGQMLVNVEDKPLKKALNMRGYANARDAGGDNGVVHALTFQSRAIPLNELPDWHRRLYEVWDEVAVAIWTPARAGGGLFGGLGGGGGGNSKKRKAEED